MNSMKVLLIVLILVAVLFVVIIVLGVGKHRKESTTTADTFDAKKHSVMGSFNDALSRFGPKFEVYQLQPAVGTFDLRVQSQYNLRVLPDSKHKFRQAKFLVEPGRSCSAVQYNAVGPLPEHVKNPQVSTESKDERQDEFTFTMFEGGGTLTIARSPTFAGTCKVTLQ